MELLIAILTGFCIPIIIHILKKYIDNKTTQNQEKKRKSKKDWAKLQLEVEHLSKIASSVDEILSKLAIIEKELEVSKETSRILLYDRMQQAYFYFKRQGSIKLFDLQNITKLYDQYKSLGGNGVGDELYSHIKDLEIEGKDD